MIFRILGLILLVLFTGSIYAQEPESQPDIASHIGPEVIILDSVVNTSSSANPSLLFDNETRTIQVYDATNDTWTKYAYPETVDALANIKRQGTLIILTLPLKEDEGWVPEKLRQWILDPNTGEFQQPEIVCGYSWRDEPEDAQWVIHYDTDKPQNDICNTATGDTLLLPLNGLGWIVDLSPDKNYLLLYGHRDTDEGLYAYAFDTHELLWMGDAIHHEIESVSWLGNNWFLLSQTQMPDGYPSILYSLGNVTQEGSFHQVTYTIKPATITVLDNPKRFEWVEKREDHCVLVQIHQSDGHRDEYAGDLCYGTKLANTDDRIHIEIIAEEIPQDCTDCWLFYFPYARRITRFNPYTGYQKELAYGEIESLMSITPDGKYGIVVLDDNGQIDMLAVYDGFPYQVERHPTHFRYAIMDLETGALLYETVESAPGIRPDYWYEGYYEPSGQINPSYRALGDTFNAPKDSFYSIGEDTFIFKHYDEDNVVSHTLIQLGEPITERTIDQPVLYIAETQDLFLQVANGDTYDIVRYNVVDESRQIILTGITANYETLLLDEYRLSIKKGETGDTLNLSLYGDESRQSIGYVIQFR